MKAIEEILEKVKLSEKDISSARQLFQDFKCLVLQLKDHEFTSQQLQLVGQISAFFNQAQELALLQPTDQKESGSTGQSNQQSEQLEPEQIVTPFLFQNMSDSLASRIQKQYSNHQIDQCISGLAQLRGLERGESALSPVILDRIQHQYKTVTFIDEKISSQAWELSSEKKDTKLYTIQEDSAVGFKIVSKCHVGIKEYLALVCEIDLFSKYMPFVDRTVELQTLSRNERIGYAHVKLPVVADRQIVFYALGYNRIKHNGTLLFLSLNLSGNQALIQRLGVSIPPLSPGHQLLEYKYFAVQFNPTLQQITVVSCLDLKLNFVPMWVVRLGVKQFAFDYSAAMSKCFQDFAIWQQRIKDKPQFYQYFEQQIKQF